MMICSLEYSVEKEVIVSVDGVESRIVFVDHPARDMEVIFVST